MRFHQRIDDFNDSIVIPSGNGKSAFKMLLTRFGCSPKSFLNDRSTFGLRYFAIMICALKIVLRKDN